MIQVIAKLDAAARARLSWIQSFAASFGVVPRPIYGHILLAEVEGSAAEWRSALAGQGAVTADFREIGVLADGRTIAALAAREGTLEALHRRVAPGTEWTPHTALFHDERMDPGWIRAAMGQMFEPFTARVERIEFREDGRILDTIELEEVMV